MSPPCIEYIDLIAKANMKFNKQSEAIGRDDSQRTQNMSPQSKAKRIIYGVAGGLLLAFILGLLVIWYCQSKTKKKETNYIMRTSEGLNNLELPGSEMSLLGNEKDGIPRNLSIASFCGTPLSMEAAPSSQSEQYVLDFTINYGS